MPGNCLQSRRTRTRRGRRQCVAILERSAGCRAVHPHPADQASLQHEPGGLANNRSAALACQRIGDTCRQKFMQPTQHDSVIDPAPATNPRERYCPGAIPGEPGWGICQTSIRASGHSFSSRATATCNMATSPIFLYSASRSFRPVATMTPHLVSNSGPQNPANWFVITRPLIRNRETPAILPFLTNYLLPINRKGDPRYESLKAGQSSPGSEFFLTRRQILLAHSTAHSARWRQSHSVCHVARGGSYICRGGQDARNGF